MKKIFVLLIAAMTLAGCRTNEANYRAAYEKAIAGRDDGAPLDSTIYGKVRREMKSSMLVADADSVPLRTMHVNHTPDENNAVAATTAQYGVVAGQFKTLFNARSLCRRLHDAGYKDASIVNTSEPYYYVVASWHTGGTQAIHALRKLEKEAPVAMREPVPFMLKPAGR